ncbi:MAG: threonine ammonia-lyase, biosynthetic [Polyangiaceae bacterium]
MKRAQPSKRTSSPVRAPTLSAYLKKILTSRVYDVAVETSLERAEKLSARIGHNVLLKREDTQPVHSFKLRGAYNKMATLSARELAKGVICASAGNHAQGVALGAQRLRCKAMIVMPLTTPRLKIDAVIALGGQVVLHGESYSDAYAHALKLAAKSGATFVHPFDDPDVIAGQGTVAMEILRQQRGPIDAIFVAVGGGGLIAGIAAYVKVVRPEIKVIGVQMTDSDAMLRSVKAGRRVRLNEVGLFSDGTAVKQVGGETFRLVRKLVDEFIVVNTDSVCAAIKDVFEDTRSILEPAGAMGVAAIKQYAEPKRRKTQTFVTVTCGANMNFDRLRFVTERAEVGEAREALFAVNIPEARGSFLRLCELLGSRAVTEFNYRVSDANEAHLLVGLAINDAREAVALERDFKQKGLRAVNLSDDELAKSHIRHLVGGRSALAAGERLYRFVFPERPGALLRFLVSMPASSNVTLFHYRNQGDEHGAVLVGIQVPPGDERAFQAFLRGLAYPYKDETESLVYRTFLR